jgi:hypothetical protein
MLLGLHAAEKKRIIAFEIKLNPDTLKLTVI